MKSTPACSHLALTRLPLIAALLCCAGLSAQGQTFSNSTTITVPNSDVLQGPATPYPAGVEVLGVGPTLVSISVTLTNFTHAYPADVDVLLIAPNGQNVLLMSDVGSFFPVAGLNFTFTNSAGASMPSGSMLMSGTFAPTNFDPVGNVDGFPPPAPAVGPYGSSFAPLLGTNPNGQWQLFVVDDVAGNNGQFAGGWSITVTTSGPPMLALTSAVSRKMHGAAGTFEINLPRSGAPGVECRSGPAHTLVFTFSNPIVSGDAMVTSGMATIAGSPTISGNTITVDLTGVSNVQDVEVTLSNVTDNLAQVLPDTVVPVRFLLGDVTANSATNSSDIAQVKSLSGLPVNASNFRADVAANGAINSSDISQTKFASGSSLPTSSQTAR